MARVVRLRPPMLQSWSPQQNVDEVLAVAKRVDSSAVHVNGALSSTFVPFGGIKSSGLGHERGVEGMRMFQRLKIFSVTGEVAAQ